jgi:hypothetical protein
MSISHGHVTSAIKWKMLLMSILIVDCIQRGKNDGQLYLKIIQNKGRESLILVCLIE